MSDLHAPETNVGVPAVRWGVLISGRGSNLSSLLDLGDAFQVQVVVSSSKLALGLGRARRMGVPTALAPLMPNSKRIDFEALTELLHRSRVTHVLLAGFMKIVPPEFVASWRGRMINLHPSLLPQYPGLESIERAFQEKNDMGVSVHEVNEEVDGGALILQRRCLKAAEIDGYSLDTAEFLVHLEEQRALRDVVVTWPRSSRFKKSIGGDAT